MPFSEFAFLSNFPSEFDWKYGIFRIMKYLDDLDKNELQCSTSDVVRIANPNLPDTLDVVWSYSVLFSASDIQWASRWDPYLKMQDPQIHWFSILNSFMIVIFLSGMVAMILMRALHKDLRRYNESQEDLEQNQEETGWKLVHGDVFRTPPYPSLFASVIGTGVQVHCALKLFPEYSQNFNLWTNFWCFHELPIRKSIVFSVQNSEFNDFKLFSEHSVNFNF